MQGPALSALARLRRSSGRRRSRSRPVAAGSLLPARALRLHGLVHRRLLGHAAAPAALLPLGAPRSPGGLAATLGADGAALLWALAPLAPLAALRLAGPDARPCEGDRAAGHPSIAAAWLPAGAGGAAQLAAATPAGVRMLAVDARRGPHPRGDRFKIIHRLCLVQQPDKGYPAVRPPLRRRTARSARACGACRQACALAS